MSKDIGTSELIDVWAGSGLAVSPDVQKIEEGWNLGEQPPHEWMNWVHKTFGEKINHILANGVADWDDATPYPEGAAAQHNGSVWIAQTANTNSTPTDPNANWRRVASVEDLAAAIAALGTGINFDASVEDDPLTLVLRDNDGRAKITPGVDPLHIATVGQLGTFGVFVKADKDKASWEQPVVTTNQLRTSQQLIVEVNGAIEIIPPQTTVTMPSFVTGTDYAIWVKPGGALEATANFSTPPVSGARLLGGFHWAPYERNSDSPRISRFSLWDLKFRPSAPDPRGLVLVANSFWTGIYHMQTGVDTAKPIHAYNKQAASSLNVDTRPRRPWQIDSLYADGNVLNLSEVLIWHGFRLPSIQEFQQLAWGADENVSSATVTTITGTAAMRFFTSTWGVIGATGTIGQFGNQATNDITTGTVNNVTQGRSDEWFRVNRWAVFGGDYSQGTRSGSRYFDNQLITGGDDKTSARGVCDHVILP